MRFSQLHLVLAGAVLAISFAPPSLADRAQGEHVIPLSAGDAIDGSSVGDDFRVDVYSGYEAKTGYDEIGRNPTNVKDRVRARRYGHADLAIPGTTARVIGFDCSAESEVFEVLIRGISRTLSRTRTRCAVSLDDRVVAAGPDVAISSQSPLVVLKHFAMTVQRGPLDINLFGDVTTRGYGTLSARATPWRYSAQPADCVPMRADVEGWFQIASFLSMEASATKVYDKYESFGEVRYCPRGYSIPGTYVGQIEISKRAGIYDGVSESYWTEEQTLRAKPSGNGGWTYEMVTIPVKVFREIGEMILCGAGFESDLHAYADHFGASVQPDDLRADVYGSAHYSLWNHDGLLLLVVDQKVTVSNVLGDWGILIDMVAFFAGDLINLFTSCSIPLLGEVIWRIEQEVMDMTVGREVIHSEVLAAAAQPGGKWVQYSDGFSVVGYLQETAPVLQSSGALQYNIPR